MNLKTYCLYPKRKLLKILFLLFFLKSTTVFSQTCTNWLYTPGQPSYVRVGDLDITGDQITVEAIFNRTAPWNGVDLFQGDLVSKHEDPTDCNYLLRPSSAEITTTNGYFKTPQICPIELNKTYHAAFVYDGHTLKFYRNGFLMSQIAATGNLVQNDWQTQIGLYYHQITQENFVGYINEVRIWKIARTQSQIRSTMSTSLASPATIPGLLAYYTFDNLLNKQGNATWNGTLGGNASINTTNPVCKLVVDSCFVPCPSLGADFQFEQNTCSPNTVAFKTSLSNIVSYEWDFGNGSKTINNISPTNTYTSFGSYPVKLKIGNSSGCFDSVTKTVAVFSQQANLILTPDTTLCSGTTVLLRTSGSELDFCWSPVAGLSNSKAANPVAAPLKSTTYIKTSKTLGSNLVVNGDFNSDNIGFSSDYTLSNSGVPAGVYAIGTNPAAWNPGMTPCTDHTTGNGKMLLVNGAQNQNVKVWSQTIAVTPNTTYAFATWLQTITTVNPAKLQFSINGALLGDAFSASAQSCEWQRFFSTWNSGVSTTATIAIVNMNQEFSGNDFALDDIFFGELNVKWDSVKVTIAEAPTISVGPDVTTCTGETVQLNATVTGSDKISWSPSMYLNNATITNPVATPDNTITYIAKAANNSGCFKQDTLVITAKGKPTIYVRKDTAICAGTSIILKSETTNAISYKWTPATGLSDAASPNPVAKPATTTKYTVVASNGGCTASDSVALTVNSVPVVSLSNDTTICGNAKVQLIASGGSMYQWTPRSGLSSTNISNPVASPAATSIYHVNVTGVNGCTQKDSIIVKVVPSPVFTIQPVTQAICYGSSASIVAKGGDSYNWLPAPGLANSSVANIKVNPPNTTVYKVLVKSTVCNIQDTLSAMVQVNSLPVSSVFKSNDIDCSNTVAQLKATGGVSYEWSPSATLSNNKVSDPVATANETTTYYVKVTSAKGCSVKDSITVNVLNTGKNGFHVPSAFTPNHDGKNDCFSIQQWGRTTDFILNIYNRWGQLVFSTKNPADCWDGNYKGREEPSDVFVYYIKAKTLCGDVFKKGTLSLIR